jgi:hypothetical protein
MSFEKERFSNRRKFSIDTSIKRNNLKQSTANIEVVMMVKNELFVKKVRTHHFTKRQESMMAPACTPYAYELNGSRKKIGMSNN